LFGQIEGNDDGLILLNLLVFQWNWVLHIVGYSVTINVFVL